MEANVCAVDIVRGKGAEGLGGAGKDSGSGGGAKERAAIHEEGLKKAYALRVANEKMRL